jgi:hypothetical protein
MRKIFFSCLLLIVASYSTYSQGWPSHVTVINMDEKDSAVVQGDLAKGSLMQDLSWAWNSSNACFPGTQAHKFKGNHVFFALTMPGQCELFISATPTDANGDLSIYAYRIGAADYNLVPDLSRCITCESDQKWDGKWKGKVQTSERKVSFQNPGQVNYNILIGVSAPMGVTTGQFSLKIKLVQ